MRAKKRLRWRAKTSMGADVDGGGPLGPKLRRLGREWLVDVVIEFEGDAGGDSERERLTEDMVLLTEK